MDKTSGQISEPTVSDGHNTVHQFSANIDKPYRPRSYLSRASRRARRLAVKSLVILLCTVESSSVVVGYAAYLQGL